MTSVTDAFNKEFNDYLDTNKEANLIITNNIYNTLACRAHRAVLGGDHIASRHPSAGEPPALDLRRAGGRRRRRPEGEPPSDEKRAAGRGGAQGAGRDPGVEEAEGEAGATAGNVETTENE